MIGVFDSGFGGLTILRALRDLPGRPDLIYLGDNARAPYGTKSGPEIVRLTQDGCQHLFDLGCRLVILGCNTAATVALRHLQQNWIANRSDPPVNLLGIVVPTIEAATGKLWAEVEGRADHRGPVDTIALFATPRTVESGVFQTEIAKRRPDLNVTAQACPNLAGAIEAGRPTHELQAMITDYVDRLRQRLGGNPSRAILGCTHYPLVADLFAQALGPDVIMIDQPSAVAQALAHYLSRHKEYAVSPGQGLCRMLTTGYQPQAMGLAESYWGTKLSFETISFGDRAA